MSEISHDWLKAFVNKKPTATPYYVLENSENPDAGRVILTGDTSELQTFVLHHQKTEGAWKNVLELKKLSYDDDLNSDTARNSVNKYQIWGFVRAESRGYK
jgi:hypothetical protein